jgi:hypothetical protein
MCLRQSFMWIGASGNAIKASAANYNKHLQAPLNRPMVHTYTGENKCDRLKPNSNKTPLNGGY